MSEVFKVKVDNSSEFDISKDDISNLDAVSTKGKYHILQNNASYKAEVLNSEFNNKSYSVKVNSNTYQVKIADKLDQLISKMGFAIGTNKQIDFIKAPMPGLILDVMVKEGEEVKEDDALLILEAMKMENIITSPRNGIVKTVNIAKGNAIDKGHLLIKFE
ncbi:MAG: biotin/lipoyl-binding protein [Flavobacteriaceae bacterium]|nr:biotin/lipoyl-binding protein [Flavobacteriaceae bacterium]